MEAKKWMKAIFDPKTAAALAGLVITWASIFSTYPTMPAAATSDEKSEVQRQRGESLRAGVYATLALLGAAIAAMGYEVGKLNEGTVASGATARPVVAPAPTVIVPVQVPPTAGTGGTPGTGGSGMVPLIILAILPALLFSGGCAGTSVLFKRGVEPSVTAVSKTMDRYYAAANWDLNHDGAVDASELQSQTQQRHDIDALKSSVAVPDKITLDGVRQAWTPIDPAFRGYVQADVNEPTPEDKQDLIGTADAINRAIAAEAARQKNILNFFAPKPATP